MEQVAPRSVSPTISAGVARKAAPIPSSLASRDGRLCGEHSPRERTTEELISFGGIPDPVASGRRVSNRIQEQPDADDLQLARAKRTAMLRDVEATTGHLQSYCLDPYVVLTHSYGIQGAVGYLMQPLGDGSTGFIQPVRMAVA
ncbi:hypothetical protein VPH35_063713 [Triticum aestivum]